MRQKRALVLACVTAAIVAAAATWTTSGLASTRGVASVALRPWPASLHFAAPLEGGDAAQQQLGLTYQSGSPTDMFSWTVTTSAPWLTLSASGGTGTEDVEVAARRAGLSPGIHYAIIVFSSPTAVNSPMRVPVSLDVPVDFGDVTVGSSLSRAFGVFNDTGGSLRVDGVTLEQGYPVEDRGEFTVRSDDVVNHGVAAGQAVQGATGFTPKSAAAGAPRLQRRGYIYASFMPVMREHRWLVNAGGTGVASYRFVATGYDSSHRLVSYQTSGSVSVRAGKTYDLWTTVRTSGGGDPYRPSIHTMRLSFVSGGATDTTTYDNVYPTGSIDCRFSRYRDAYIKLDVSGALEASTGVSVFGVGVAPTVLPQAKLSRPTLVPATPRRARRFAVSGTIHAAHAGTVRLYFCRRSATRWVRLASTSVTTTSRFTRYRKTIRLGRKGSWYVQAYHRCSRHRGSWSPRRYFKVR